MKISPRRNQVLGWLLAFVASNQLRNLILALFVVQAAFLGLSIQIGEPPDELTHIRFIEYYAEQKSPSPFIFRQTDNFWLGDVVRSPSYLYHYLASLLYRVLPFAALTNYIILRMISVVISLLTLIMLSKLSDLLGLPKAVRNLTLAVLSLLAGFSFLSYAVNNDQLIWLATVSGLWLMVSLHQSLSSGDFRAKVLLRLTLLISLIMLGSVTKKTFLPIGFCLAIMAGIYLVRYRSVVFNRLRQPRPMMLIGTLLIIFSSGLFVERIGGNLVRFGGIDPACDKLLSYQHCQDYGVFRRNERLRKAKDPKHSYLNPISYAPGWLFKNVQRTLGTQSWSRDVPPPLWLGALALAVLMFGLAIGLNIGLRQFIKAKKRASIPDWPMLILVLAIGFGFLNFMINYHIYRKFAVNGLALQARYLFPLLGPFLLVTIYYINIWLVNRRCLKVLLVALTIAGLFIFSGPRLILFQQHHLSPSPFKLQLLSQPEAATAPYEPSY